MSLSWLPPSLAPALGPLRWLVRHWPHLLLFPFLAIAVTIAHEGAHAAAVLWQGGTLTELSFLPARGEWGHVRYHLPASASPSARALVSLAPYALWSAVSALTWLVSLTRRPLPFAVASTLFLWGYAVPVGDIANTAVPFALGGTGNDFGHAFGAPSAATHALSLVAGLGAVIAGYGVQRRLYREAALGPGGYVALAAAGVLALLLLQKLA